MAVFCLGIMAGFFGTYAANVSPAMLEMDGWSYVQAQGALNRHVRHALFFVFFFGPVCWCGLAVAGAWRARRQPWWWLMAGVGMAYALGIVWFTRAVNLPLNYQTEGWAAAGVPGVDWEVVRAAWNRANRFRAGLCALLFALALAAWMGRTQAGLPRR